MSIEKTYTELKQHLGCEMHTMRELLGLIHQMEYSILSGDENLSLRLNQAVYEAEYTLSQLRTHRQCLINQLCTYFQCEPEFNDNLALLLQSYDEDEAGPVLFEQIELLECEIQDQYQRNASLIQAIDPEQSLPQTGLEDPVAFYPIPPKTRRKSTLIAVDFAEDDFPE